MPGTEWGAEPAKEDDPDRAAFQAELERVAAEVSPASECRFLLSLGQH